MPLYDVIEDIMVNVIPDNTVFTSHTIIKYLIQKRTDDYLHEHPHGYTTRQYHSEIGKLIAEIAYNRNYVLLGPAWGYNI